MRQVSSILALMLVLTFLAVFLFLSRMAGDQTMAAFMLVLMLPLLAYSVLSSVMFSVLYALGKMNKYIHGKVVGAESPFASDRLPTQIVTPITSDDAK